MDELKLCIEHEIFAIQSDILQSAVSNFWDEVVKIV